MSEWLDIKDIRHRNRNAIKNTATGKCLANALYEVERLRLHLDKANRDIDRLESWVFHLIESAGGCVIVPDLKGPRPEKSQVVVVEERDDGTVELCACPDGSFPQDSDFLIEARDWQIVLRESLTPTGGDDHE